jgi:hypothetical protein
MAAEFLIEGDDLIRVVGVSHYQDALRSAASVSADDDEVRVECVATLHPEPGNPHDPNAIQVKVGGEPAGYLARDEAPRWKEVAALLAEHDHVAAAEAMVAGRGGLLGLFLRLPTPTEARAQVGIRFGSRS